jgi:hypothetical protein
MIMHKDSAGQFVTTPDNQPPIAGIYVTLHTPNGPVQAVTVGGPTAVPLKTGSNS